MLYIALFIIFVLPVIIVIHHVITSLYGLIKEPRIHREWTKTIIGYTYSEIPKEELPFSDTDGCSPFFKKGVYYPCHQGGQSFYGCLKDPNHKYHRRCRELFDKYSLVLYDRQYRMFGHPLGGNCPLRKIYLKRLIDWLVKDKTCIKPKKSNIGYAMERVVTITVLSLSCILYLSMTWSFAWPMAVDVWNGAESFYLLLAVLIMPGLSVYALVQCIRDKV